MTKLSLRRSCVNAILSLMVFGVCGSAHAAIHTWTGLGGNALWSTAANWNGGKPTTGESGGTTVIFNSNVTSTMDVAGLVVDLVEFIGSGNTVNGTTTLGINGDNLTVNIQNDSGTNTLSASLPVKFAGIAGVEAVVTAGTLTMAGNVSSSATSGGIILANSSNGTLIFTGASNTYTGVTNVLDGTLELNSNGFDTAIPGPLIIGRTSGGSAVVRLLQSLEIANTSAVTVNATGTLDLNENGDSIGPLTGSGNVTLGTTGSGSLTFGDSSSFTFSGTISGSGACNKTGTGTVIWTAKNLTTGTFVVANGELDLQYGGSGAGWTSALQIGFGTGAAGSARVVLNVNSQLTAAPSLIINSDGLLTANTHGTFVGSVVINDGSMALGSGSLSTVSSLTMTGGSITATTGTLSLGGNLVATASAKGGASIGGNVLLNAATRTLTVNSGPSQPELTINGLIADGAVAPSGLFKAGMGTLALVGTASYTYTGVTDVDQGVVTMSSLLGVIIPGALVIGNLSDPVNSATVRELQSSDIRPSSAVRINGSGRLDLNGFGDTVATLDVMGGSTTLGAGTLVVSGALTLNGGTITATTGLLSLGGDVTSSGSSSITAHVFLNAATRTLTVNSGASQPELTITGVIADGSVASGLFKAGTGTLALVGTGNGNTYSGTTTVDKGVLTMNASVNVIIPGALIIGNAFDPANSAVVREMNSSDLNANSAVQINASGQLDLNAHSDVIQGLTGTGNLALNNGGTLTVGNANVSSTFNGGFSGQGHLVKTGNGTLTLGGSTLLNFNILTVSHGTLLVNGSLGPDSTVNVSATATLGGSGEVGNVLGSAGSFIVPGGVSLGSLSTIMPFNLSGASLAVRINEAAGAVNDEIATEDVLNISATTLNIALTGAATRNAYIIASYGTLTGTFGAVTGIPSGYTLNYAYSDGSPYLHIALVGPQSVVTGPASSILGSSAKLNGTINPAGKTNSWYFQYGLTNLYGSKTPIVTGLTGSAAKPVSALISGLDGGSTYHFQLVANNSSGPAYGADVTFITNGPRAVTGAPSLVSALSATVAGTVDAVGVPTTSWFEYGLSTSYGSKSALHYAGSSVLTVPVSAHLTGLVPDKFYHYRLVASNVGGISRGGDRLFVTLTVYAPSIAPAGQPVSRMVAVGTAVTFTVAITAPATPTDSIPTYQWFKNGAPLAGAKAASYTLPFTTLAQAGRYACVVTNAGGTATTVPAELGVVDQTAKTLTLGSGSSTTLTAIAAGNGLNYAWLKNSNVVPGVMGNTLVLSALQTSDDAVYYCAVSNLGGGIATGLVTLRVFDAAPIILTPVVMPAAIAGGSYSFQIPVDTSSNVAPTSYSAANLPAGLTVNASGLISGTPKPGITTDTTYMVTLKAINSKGTSPAVTTALLVHPFPANVAGVYNGLVDRDPLPPGTINVNGGLGGNISLAVTATGSFTGKLTLGAASYPIAGAFSATLGSTQIFGSTFVTRATSPSKLVVGLVIDGSGSLSGYVAVANVTPGVAVSLAGQLNPWNAASHPAPLAATYNSQITFFNPAQAGTDPATSPPGNAANVVWPQGRGYAAVTITPGGAVTWTGRMGDGTAPATIFTTTLDQNGFFWVHFMLDGNTGAVAGTVTVAADSPVPKNGGLAVLDGTLDWNKNAQPSASTDHTYKSGIPVVDLTITGGQYVALAPGVPVLGITPSNVVGNNNAHLLFTEGGLTGPAPITPATNAADVADISLRITPANTADLSNILPAGNPRGLSLTINAGTGALSGGFTLKDGAVSRPVTFHGLVVPRLSVKLGVGYFLLSELPTPATTPILAGQMILKGT